MTLHRRWAALILAAVICLSWASLSFSQEHVDVKGFPPLTEAGFLPEGEKEFVFINADEGLWLYASQEYRIQITRHVQEKPRMRWLTAEIIVKDGAAPFRMYSHDHGNILKDRAKYYEKPVNIAKNHNLVFSMDGDYFIYRLSASNRSKYRQAVGVAIRQGEILVDIPASEKRNTYPPLDMLALFPDGDMRVYKAREKTAQELADLGAMDVLSFGPYLIRDGQINISYVYYGTTPQPRAAIGMVKKGHYFAVIVEGRIRPSVGMTCMELSGLMADLGCTTAFNLDGGWTSAMVFMGKQLNQLDNTGIKDNAREQNEVMGIGHTDAYQALDLP